MKISVLMPTYNCPPELFEKALISVLNQGYDDFEIIIKDGNYDEPACRHEKIAQLLGPFLTRKVKYGCSAEKADRANNQNSYYEALNWCIENSTGDILTVLSSDDETGNPDTFRCIEDRFARRDKHPFFLYGACEWITKESDHICYKVPPVVPVTYDEILRDFPFYTPAVFWNRAVHDKFGLFDAENCPWSGDLEFYLRIWRGIYSEFTPRVIGKYRVWEVSQQRKHGDLAGIEANRILEKYRGLR